MNNESTPLDRSDICYHFDRWSGATATILSAGWIQLLHTLLLVG